MECPERTRALDERDEQGDNCRRRQSRGEPIRGDDRRTRRIRLVSQARRYDLLHAHGGAEGARGAWAGERARQSGVGPRACGTLDRRRALSVHREVCRASCGVPITAPARGLNAVATAEPKHLLIATRLSELALRQARQVQSALARAGVAAEL